MSKNSKIETFEVHRVTKHTTTKVVNLTEQELSDIRTAQQED